MSAYSTALCSYLNMLIYRSWCCFCLPIICRLEYVAYKWYGMWIYCYVDLWLLLGGCTTPTFVWHKHILRCYLFLFVCTYWTCGVQRHGWEFRYYSIKFNVKSYIIFFLASVDGMYLFDCRLRAGLMCHMLLLSDMGCVGWIASRTGPLKI